MKCLKVKNKKQRNRYDDEVIIRENDDEYNPAMIIRILFCDVEKHRSSKPINIKSFDISQRNRFTLF